MATCSYCWQLKPNCVKCPECKKCRSICVCKFVKHFTSKLEFHTPSNKQYTKNLSQRFIAAEIEVAGIGGYKKDLEKVIRDWKGSVVHDGSLPVGGFEINTAPAAGDLFINQINDICLSLNNANAIISERCGLHVHLDARDYNFYDIRRLIKVYSAIEPTIFSLVPKHRRESIYCTPCAKKYEIALKDGKLAHKEVKEAVVIGTYGRLSTEERQRKYTQSNTTRRNALNIHSWFYRGTIECRLFEGTINAADIINWGMLWARIMDYTLSATDEEVAIITKSNNCLFEIVKDNIVLKDFVEKRHNKYSKGVR